MVLRRLWGITSIQTYNYFMVKLVHCDCALLINGITLITPCPQRYYKVDRPVINIMVRWSLACGMIAFSDLEYSHLNLIGPVGRGRIVRPSLYH